MQFPAALIKGRLVRRYQRFLADVDVEGQVMTVHCPNPGALLGLNDAGNTVWISRSPNLKRRLSHTLEIVEYQGPGGDCIPVGINTGLPNKLIQEAILSGRIPELAGYDTLRREVPYGVGSRIDMLLTSASRPAAYIEVKNVHLCRTSGLAEFPDCVTVRGAKHLRELAAMAESGARAVMVFCVQRADCSGFMLAGDLDPVYAATFADATARGVETLIYGCHISSSEIAVQSRIPFADGPMSLPSN